MILDNGIIEVANGKSRAGGLMGEKGARHREDRICPFIHNRNKYNSLNFN